MLSVFTEVAKIDASAVTILYVQDKSKASESQTTSQPVLHILFKPVAVSLLFLSQTLLLTFL